MVGDKFRIRFSKNGDLRLLSHHDLMRCFERILRRADVPFRSTSGFHPHPRMVFALSLSLGVVGHAEVLELELTHSFDADELLTCLRRQAPGGIEFQSAKVIDPRVTAQPRRMVYRVSVPLHRFPDIAERCQRLRDCSECWVIRTRPHRRKINIRPYIREIRLCEKSPEMTFLELDLWVTPTGTARADELLGVLGLRGLEEEGFVLERTELELHDEIHETSPVGPEWLQRGLEGTNVAEVTPEDLLPIVDETEQETPPSAEWGASPHGPVVE